MIMKGSRKERCYGVKHSGVQNVVRGAAKYCVRVLNNSLQRKQQLVTSMSI